MDAAEEVLPGIKNDLLLGKFKPRETDVAAVARASPEERREKAEQLRVIPEKKPKADKESARSGTKRQQEVYATIDKSYEDMKDSKRVTEDSALVSLRYTARKHGRDMRRAFYELPRSIGKAGLQRSGH